MKRVKGKLYGYSLVSLWFSGNEIHKSWY